MKLCRLLLFIILTNIILHLFNCSCFFITIHLGHHFYDSKEQCVPETRIKDELLLRLFLTHPFYGKPSCSYQLLYQLSYNIMKDIREVERILIKLLHNSVSKWPVPYLFGLVSLFNGISTFVGYLMPKPFS